MIDDLKGKRILVIGSSTGIGAAVARAYAGLGAKVGVHYNSSREDAEALATEIKAAGGDVLLVGGDVSKSAGATKVVEEAVAGLGGLDVLVNNAGALLKRVPLGQIDDELYEKVLDLNIRAVIMATQAALPHLRKAGGGSIIHTTSVAARNGGGPGALLYASSKAFVSNTVRNMAKELAGEHIRVNGVAPGVILTPFHERYSTPEMLETMRKTIPMGTLGTPEDCVGAYLFLASEKLSGYVTGQIIEVNGGQLMP
ncbi:SDR family NAD(P)-dependent oxidoreductase [Bosea thiooxidans]